MIINYDSYDSSYVELLESCPYRDILDYEIESNSDNRYEYWDISIGEKIFEIEEFWKLADEKDKSTENLLAGNFRLTNFGIPIWQNNLEICRKKILENQR